MRLNLLGHLVAFGAADSLVLGPFDFRSVSESTKPPPGVLLNQNNLLVFACEPPDQQVAFYLFPEKVRLNLEDSLPEFRLFAIDFVKPVVLWLVHF